MNGNPTEAEDASYYSADTENVDWSHGVGDIGWEDAPYDTAARYDGQHVEGELGGEASGVSKLGNEEEWYVEADEADERG